jgi:hypothetical protein
MLYYEPIKKSINHSYVKAYVSNTCLFAVKDFVSNFAEHIKCDLSFIISQTLNESHQIYVLLRFALLYFTLVIVDIRQLYKLFHRLQSAHVFIGFITIK